MGRAAGSGGDGVPHSHPRAAGLHPPVLRAQGCGSGRVHRLGQNTGIRDPHPTKAQQAGNAAE